MKYKLEKNSNARQFNYKIQVLQILKKRYDFLNSIDNIGAVEKKNEVKFLIEEIEKL